MVAFNREQAGAITGQDVPFFLIAARPRRSPWLAIVLPVPHRGRSA
jgi:hypothetical protein